MLMVVGVMEDVLMRVVGVGKDRFDEQYSE